jgi:hypothetical protein
MERCLRNDFVMSTTAITRSSLPTIGAYIPAVFLGAYLQSSSQIPFVQAILFSLPIITLGIARSRTLPAPTATPHLVSVPQPDIDTAEHTPAFSFISRAS